MNAPAGITKLLWSRFTWRHWRQSLRSSVLLVTILALGVAAFFSIRLANRAAVSGFQFFSENLTGGSDLIVRAPGGHLPAQALRDLRDATVDLPLGIFPVLESSAAWIQNPENEIDASEDNASAPLLRLTGVDWIALGNAYYLEADDKNNAPPPTSPLSSSSTSEENEDTSILSDPFQAFVAPELARRNDLKTGDTLRVAIDDRIVELTIAGILYSDPARPEAPANLLLFDLPGLQKLLNRPDQISRAELRVPAGADRDRILAEAKKRINSLAIEKQWLVETPDDRAATSESMTAAFRLNLTVLSTLALLVGMYLILQALEAAVVRRRKEIAVLRSLGVTAAQIRKSWLFEALALGIVGTFLGLVLGWGAAQLAVGNIAKTVSALYYQTTTTAAGIHWGEVLFAAIFGIGASLIAGWLPARDAGRTPPVQALRGGQNSPGPILLRRPWTGVLLLATGWLLCQLGPWTTAAGTRIPVGGYLAALVWLVALSILAGALFRPLAAILSARKRQVATVYAGSQLRRPTGRHRLTAAGLVVAVGMAAGMGILVHSFERTLTSWISDLLKADLYVAPAGVGSASSEAVISEQNWQAMLADEGVSGADLLSRYPITFDGKPTVLAGAEYATDKRSLRLNWQQAPSDPDPRSLTKRKADGTFPAWISDSFSRRFEKTPGDTITIPTPAGSRTITVEGVYIDYHNENGTLLLHRGFTSEWFADNNSAGSLAVFLRSGVDPEAVRARWSEAHPALVIRTNRRIREEALRVFHQTFGVTHALEAIGIAVAVAGLALTLASLMIERRSEITTLKQLGMDRNRIARAAAVEGFSIALVGTSAGIVLSLALGYVLIYVVNRQSFGWTLEYHIPVLSIAGLSLLTLVTSVAVGYFVGRSGAHLRAEQEE